MPKLTEFIKGRALQRDPVAADKVRARPLQHAWYKIGGTTVHLDGRNLPAPCAKCRGMSEYLCDYPVTEAVTCSAPLCKACAKPIGNNRQLCPLHVKVLANRKGSLL